MAGERSNKFGFSLSDVGKWRIPIDYARAAMEKIQIEFLRFRADAGEAVSIFHHFRSIFDGPSDFAADGSVGFASTCIPSYSHIGRNEADDSIGRCSTAGLRQF